jgi:hypothetical protein
MADKIHESLSNASSSLDPDTAKEREVSCRVTCAVIKYFESMGYDLDYLLQDLPNNKCN